jgi:hypothetical protein
LHNITSIGSELWITDNPLLENIEALANIALSSYYDLYIINNPLLSQCDIDNICEYLVDPTGTIEIYDNAEGCNSPEEVEEACEDTSCLPEGIHFHTQEEIDSFQTNYPGCTEVEGWVTIDDMYSASITDLSGLNVLTSIGGNLDIGNSLALTKLTGLEELTVIGGDLELHYLNSSAFTNLTGLEGLTAIGGKLSITHCNYIINLTGLEGLISVGDDLHITYNLSLNDFTGLDGLTTIDDWVYIMYNQSLTNLTGLEGLTTVGNNLWVVDNDPLTNLLGLEGLTEVGGSLHISDNTNMTNLSGIEGLTSIGGSLQIEDNPVLISLTGLENVNYIGDNLAVSGNEILPNLEGLNNISYIGGKLSLSENITLTDLTGLNGLTTVNGSMGLNIYSNANLASLTGIENLELVNGSIYIGIDDPLYGGFGNPVLNDISALENLDPDSISSLHIVFNNSLSNCHIQSICDYLAAPNGYVEIHDNAPGCNNPEEVEEACLYISVPEYDSKIGFTITPNPLGPSSFVKYTIHKSSHVTLQILDLKGSEILSLINEIKTAGEHNAVIDGASLKPGVYFCILKTNESLQTMKMIKL